MQNILERKTYITISIFLHLNDHTSSQKRENNRLWKQRFPNQICLCHVFTSYKPVSMITYHSCETIGHSRKTIGHSHKKMLID